MALSGLEKAGLDSLLRAKMKDAEDIAQKCEQEYQVEGQHPDFYNRVRSELYLARGVVQGLSQAKRLMEKHL